MKYIVLILLIAISCRAAVIKVGPGLDYSKPSQVASLVADGDTVDIMAGVYEKDVCIWRKNNLLLRGIGGRAHLKCGGAYAEGKAIWVIKGKNTVVENIEFSEAKVPDKNGAGIRQEGDNLAARNCYFHHCEMGILTGASQTSDIYLLHCEFSYNGYGDGYSHNIYIGNINSFTMMFCYSHHSKIGHNVKSRANNNYVMYNRITDEMDGESSMNIDLPNGGASYIIGNLIMQGPPSENSAMVTYGQEGLKKNPDNRLYVVNNTFVNKKDKADFIVINDGTAEAKVINNIFTGSEAETAKIVKGPALIQANVQKNNIADMHFVDETNYDYRITIESPALDAGIDPGSSSDGNTLFPLYEYVHPLDSVARKFYESIDAGAYEYKPPTIVENELEMPAANYIEINGKRIPLQLPGNATINGIKVYNYLGEELLNLGTPAALSSCVIDSILPAGVYFIVIEAEGRAYYQKVCID